MSPQEKMWMGWIPPAVAQPGWRRAYTLRPVQASADALFGGRRMIDDNTTPSLRLNSGLPANVEVEIEVADGVARIVVSTLPFVASARLLAPLLGTPGAPTAVDEQAALDRFGNRNGRYDMGDLRAYMRNRPRTVTQGT